MSTKSPILVRLRTLFRGYSPVLFASAVNKLLEPKDRLEGLLRREDMTRSEVMAMVLKINNHLTKSIYKEMVGFAFDHFEEEKRSAKRVLKLGGKRRKGMVPVTLQTRVSPVHRISICLADQISSDSPPRDSFDQSQLAGNLF